MARQTCGNNSTRRQFLASSAGGLAGFLLAPPGRAADSKPPNIVFLMTDNQRWNMLGCMGNGIIQTPNIDRLSERGVASITPFAPRRFAPPAVPASSPENFGARTATPSRCRR